jgi:tetratricopeptide (TPR) repeat protein
MKPQIWQAAGVCIVLILVVFAVFGQTAGFGFINYDDDKYVYDNPIVERGLTPKGVAWALTGDKIGHSHPLTWLTHMADCQAFGLWAGGHHLTNVGLQAVAAVLLFLALREMTRKLWRSALVAAVFAIHPLQVESVAWISQRKDVLGGVFFMLTLWAYARYARKPSRWRQVAMALWYALGLLCNSALAGLPFVLLLLDWWPLYRVKLAGVTSAKMGAAKPFRELIREKIPLFLLSAGSCAASFLGQEKVFDADRASFLERLGNAVVSWGIYLWQMVLPVQLAIPYPNPPNGRPFWMVALVFVLLAVISMVVVMHRKTRPYLLLGWFWYLAMLVPASGIIQRPYHAQADHCAYLAGIGLVLIVTWAVADWSLAWRHRRAGPAGLMAVVVGILMACSCIQAGFWRNNETLWSHTLACTADNYLAHYNLGAALFEKGRVDGAITHFQTALQINPGYAEACNGLGQALRQKGRPGEAIANYQKALQIRPGYANAHYNLAIVLRQKGRMDEAIAQYREALQINPDYADAHNNLGIVLLQKGATGEAVNHLQRALQINPDYADAHNNLGIVLLQKGATDEAIDHFQKALQIRPDYAEAYNNLGNALRRKGRLDEAIAQYQIALQLNAGYAEAHRGLGNALLQKGNVDEAITHFQDALQIKPADPASQNNLAWVLATSGQASLRNGAKALQLARQANTLTGGERPFILHTLAAAFAEAGQFPDAVETAQHALRLAQAQSDTRLAAQLRSEVKLYQAGKPYHIH